MDFIPEPAPTIRQLLAFYLEAGVDCALAEEPVDRLAEPEVPAAAVESAKPPHPAWSKKSRPRWRPFRAAK